MTLMIASFHKNIILIVHFIFSFVIIASAQEIHKIHKLLYSIKSVPAKYTSRQMPRATKWILFKEKPYLKIKMMDTLVIPYLIEKLEDTTITGISYNCDSSKLCRGDIALFLINDIERIPEDMVTQVMGDVVGVCGLFPVNFFESFRQDRKKFQEKYRKYYFSSERQSYLKLIRN